MEPEGAAGLGGLLSVRAHVPALLLSGDAWRLGQVPVMVGRREPVPLLRTQVHDPLPPAAAGQVVVAVPSRMRVFRLMGNVVIPEHGVLWMYVEVEGPAPAVGGHG